MSGSSLGLGLRYASYGSLQQQLHNNLLPNQLFSPLPPPPLPFTTRKPAKMMKEKERLVHLFDKTVGRKKIGMLFLSVVSIAVFIWVLYVGKGSIFLTFFVLLFYWSCIVCLLIIVVVFLCLLICWFEFVSLWLKLD